MTPTLDLTIAIPTPKDLPAFRKIMIEGARAIPASEPVNTRKFCSTWRFRHLLSRRENYTLLIARIACADLIIGALETKEWWREEGHNYGYVQMVSVLPNYQRMGVATALYNAYGQSLLENGISKLYARINSRSAISLAFHQSLGFVFDETANNTPEYGFYFKTLV